MFLSSTAIMKSNTIPLCVVSSVWLYGENPRHSFSHENFSRRFYVVSVVILSIWFYNHDHLIFLCHLQFYLQTLRTLVFFVLLFKYCCTLPVHAHKDKLNLYKVLLCFGRQGLMFCWASLNWAVFGLLKDEFVGLTKTCTLGRPGRIPFYFFCTNRKRELHNKCSQ